MSAASSRAAAIFSANQGLNQLLIASLDPAAWLAQPPGGVRAIAAIFSHMHNVRCKWIRLSAPALPRPAQLNRARCTPRQAAAALAASAAGCEQLLALAGTFRRDGWAAPWPAGPEALAYMLAHEAHHRGQVCMLAHQLGFRLPAPVTSRLWNWDRLARSRPGA